MSEPTRADIPSLAPRGEPRRSTLLEMARAGGYAIPAINVSNMETVQAAVAAAEDCSAPIILQLSPGAIAYAGYDMLRQIATSAAIRASVPVLVHLDHCRDSEMVLRAVADGFPSVMYDGSSLPAEVNERLTADIADAAHRRGVLVEAELGIIGGSESMTLSDARAAMTSPEEAASFVAATRIDVLAPALGNLHRMPDDSVQLDVVRVREIADAAGVPIALHGGSGVDQAQLADLIDAGVAKVNLSTRVGRAFGVGVGAALAEHPDGFDIRVVLGEGRKSLYRLVQEYVDRCGARDRAPVRSTATEWTDAMDEPE